VCSNANLSGEERVTRRAFIRSRCDNDPRPFNDLPKAYWHGTVLPYGVSEIIFKHDNILVRFPGPRHRGRPRTPCAAGRGYLTRIITNAMVPLARTHTTVHTICTSTRFPMHFSPTLCDRRFLDRETGGSFGFGNFFFYCSSFTSAYRAHVVCCVRIRRRCKAQAHNVAMLLTG